MVPSLPPEVARLLESQDRSARSSAWAEFAAAYSPLILHAARSLGGDHDSVMDRYARVLEELQREDLRRLRTYVADGRSKFSTWLVVVTRRICLDLARSRYGRPRAAAGSADGTARGAARRRLADLVGESVDTDLLSSAGADPELELQATELRERLEYALDRLAARDRLLLRHRFEDDLSAAEIARLMDFPTPFHVYRRLNALLDSLRHALRRAGVEDAVP